MKLLTIVTVSGLSGERNAYRSVLSADGSSEMSGASRWLEAFAAVGPRPWASAATRASAVRAAAARATAGLRIAVSSCWGDRWLVAAGVDARDSRDPRNRFGSSYRPSRMRS